MYIYESAALLTAFCWAIGGMISSRPAGYLGAIGFNCLRMWMVTAMLAVFATIAGLWGTVDVSLATPIILSGFIGIFLGDTALFLTLNRLGPRRTAIIYSINAPMTVLLGWMVLDEALSMQALLGILVVFSGVVLAIVFGKRRAQLHHWEAVKGPIWIGLSFGFVAALCQAIGSILIRPVMDSGADPTAVAAMRCLIASMCLTIMMQLPWAAIKMQNKPTLRTLGRTALSGFVGMGLGMTLFLFALSGGEVGVITTLSATSPVLMLPVLWLLTKETPAVGAWIGAALVVLGCGLIFMD
ncbi:DMT family transporter [Rhodobacteraceae bacterium RKSG542]|uniref:DMT family transporter n=1 Tax=Pseudovibrio flavus TaxID=2529854 RepID=UPI0012BB5978|nr:DMT family transporter [Pseudovibrio flavus]MTI17583.1 DMT family transporter [Pseudovibrio flavus]